MTAWKDEELADLAAADELRIAPLRRAGTLHRSRIIWVVRHGDDIYVRSVNGPDGAWFHGIQATHAGHVSAGDVEADVAVEDADHALDDQIDEAVDRITSPSARSTTLRLVRSEEER